MLLARRRPRQRYRQRAESCAWKLLDTHKTIHAGQRSTRDLGRAPNGSRSCVVFSRLTCSAMDHVWLPDSGASPRGLRASGAPCVEAGGTSPRLGRCHPPPYRVHAGNRPRRVTDRAQQVESTIAPLTKANSGRAAAETRRAAGCRARRVRHGAKTRADGRGWWCGVLEGPKWARARWGVWCGCSTSCVGRERGRREP